VEGVVAGESPPSREGPQAFGALLQRHRLAAGLSQAELAERAGLSPRGISDLERGLRRAPYPATLRRLAEALELTQADRGVLLSAVHTLPVGSPSSDATEAHRAPGQHDHPIDGSSGHALPSSLSPLIGREAEMAALRQRLVPPVRLLTLTGPGGIGKTRLALALAAEQRPRFADGVFFVELGQVLDPSLVQSTIADHAGLR
jgi:transcriptional regulator with XRE-family HTH domain